MSDRTFGHKKTNTSNFSNPSLVSPHTPTLANSVRGLGLPTNNIIQTATLESTDQQEAQSADEQSLLSETIQQRSFGHDISRIALRRPQAELTMAEPGDKYEMETSESNDQQAAQPAGEKSLLSQAIEQQSFGHHISRYALRRPQAKLTLGEPGDKYEQEADWMANQVMRMVVPDKPNADSVQPVEDTLQRKCTACEEEEVQRSSDSVVSTPIALEPQPTPEIQREPNGMPPTKGTTQITKNNPTITASGKNITEAITNLTSQNQDESGAEPLDQDVPNPAPAVQTKFSTSYLQRQADGVPQVQPDLESRLSASQGGGSPLSENVRSFMEPRFGADFSQVRVHTGSDAVQMNRELGAQAFTHRSHIYYGAGKAPAKDELTGHELTHVVQQTGVGLQQKPNNVNQVQQKQIQQKIAEPGETDPENPEICDGTCPKLTEEEPLLVQRKLEVNAHHLFENGVERTDLSSASGQSSGGKSSTTGGAGATKAAIASQEKSSPAKTEASGKDSVSAPTAGATTATSSPASNSSGTSAAVAPTVTPTSAPQAGGTQTPTDNASPGGGGTAPPPSQGNASPTVTPTSTPQAGGTQAPTGNASSGGGGSAAPPSQGNAPAPGGAQTPAAGSCTPECYRGLREEPAEEPETTPANPPPAQVEAEVSEGNEEDLPEIDVCPTAPANAAVAVSATSEAPAAAATGSASTAGSGSSAGNTGVGAASGPTGASGTAAGGTPEGTGRGEGDSSLNEVTASAESQRSVAVSAYEESSAALSTVSARTEILRGGVQFVAPSGEGQVQQEQHRLVSDRAGNFFSAIANRIDEVTTYALGDIPNQLGLTAESAKAQIGASMEAQKAAISARTQQARGQAIAEAATARSAVHAQATAYVADVESQTAAAIESLTAKHAEMMVQVNGLETSTLDSINQTYTTGRTDLEGLGTTIGDECTAKGGELATQYEGFANCTEDGFWDGNLSERRAKAQAEAARSVAKAYHDRMVDAARKRAREVTRNGRQQDRCAILAAASRSRDTLDQQLPSLINAFEMTRNAAIQQAEATKDNLIASIDSSLAATLSQLNQQEQSQRQAINDTGYMQQVLQEQIAHTATSAVQKGVQTAVSSVQDAMLDIQAKFASSTIPNPGALENALSQVEQNINAAMDGLNTSVNTGTTTAEAQLVNAVQQAVTSLEGITQSNNELTATLSSGFGSAMNGIASTDNFAGQRTTVTNQLQQSVSASTTALTQILDGFHQSCNTTLAGARTTLAQAHTSLEQNLRQSKQGLECEIAHKATEAAAKEAPAWKQVLAVVLVIIVIIIVIAVIVVTAGAAGPVIVAALGGPILAGVIIGAAVGAVVSGLLALASNLWNNRANVWEGVGTAVLIGAITGAIGGALGAAAGVGTGVLFQGASRAVQTAAQFGAAMLSAGGFDAVTQWVMGGFSFQNFSWGQLGFTLLVTAITFGLAYNISARTGAPSANAPDAPETVPTADTPETVPTADTPETVPTADTPETVPTADTPETVPTADTPETVPTADTPESVPTADTPETVPTADTPESVPTADTPETVPTADTPETVPTADTPETVPTAETSEPVVEQSRQDAENIIKSGTSKNQRRGMAATSRAKPSSGEITDHFENIVPKGSKDGPRIPGDRFPGLEPTGTEGELRIADPDQFIDELKLQYERNGDSPLHPKLEEKIRAAFGKGRIFSQLDGIPGLHAEVRAANAALHQLDTQGIPITDDVIKQTSIATHRVTPNKEGEKFPACRNCTSILDIFNILTGVTK